VKPKTSITACSTIGRLLSSTCVVYLVMGYASTAATAAAKTKRAYGISGNEVSPTTQATCCNRAKALPKAMKSHWTSGGSVGTCPRVGPRLLSTCDVSDDPINAQPFGVAAGNRGRYNLVDDHGRDRKRAKRKSPPPKRVICAAQHSRRASGGDGC
jgi:hypothetical protein